MAQSHKPITEVSTTLLTLPWLRVTKSDACSLPAHVTGNQLHRSVPHATSSSSCVSGWWAYLLTQQRSSRRGGRQGLLGSPLADLLELVLNKVLQSSKLRLAAAASMHIVLICNKPEVSGAWQGFQAQAKSTQGGIRTRSAFPGPPRGAENTLRSPRCKPPSSGGQPLQYT